MQLRDIPQTKPVDASDDPTSLAAAISDPMLTSNFLSRFLLVLLLTSVAAKAEETKSLYNKQAAKKLDPAQISIFGPKAGNYRYDKRMMKAATLAAERARAHSHGSCWRYVKDAMVSAGLVDSRPKTGYAKQAAAELTKDYGFKKIRVTDPYKAPVGSVLVYGGKGAGHVEFRTKQGFVSDFVSLRPSKRPLIGVYVKPRA